jgi:hypothetical protein
MTEEDYWANDLELHEAIEAAAVQGEMLLSGAKIGQPSFGDYQIKPLYESNPWQPAKTYYMVTLWAKNVGWLFDNYEAAFQWVRQQLGANGDGREQGQSRRI